MAAGRPETGPRRIACLGVTQGGRRLAAEIAKGLPGGTVLSVRTPLGELLPVLWGEYDGLVMVMAAGIVVRLIAPLVKDKKIDPCVVVVDEAGRFAVSLLSGHLGGGNELAREVAALTSGQAVITTASDTLGHTALDLWAREQNLAVEDYRKLAGSSARLVNSGSLRIFSELPVSSLPLPEDFVAVATPEAADCIVSNRLVPWPASAAVLRPRNLVVGMGCNRGTSSHQIEAAVAEAFSAHGLSQLAIRNLASIDLKEDEAGLLAFAQARGLMIDFFSKDALNGVAGVSVSQAVLRATGAKSVAEPAALLSSAADNLLVRKMKWKDVTIAIAQAPSTLSAPAPAG
ncbi:MAG: cobalamin biosynthesis protein [Desulfobulbaceae bacterium]|nr:cobalamin biosynthesis protein [Desulfobulbaceae bacterium]